MCFPIPEFRREKCSSTTAHCSNIRLVLDAAFGTLS